MRSKKGITLVALIVTIIILMILAGVVIAVINSDNDFMQKALGTKKETTEDSIKEYVLSSYTQIITDPTLDEDPIDALEAKIINENADKNEDEQFVIKSIDKANKKIIVEHQGVILEIELIIDQEGQLDASSEDVQQKKYSVTFEYRDASNNTKKKIFYIDEDVSIQQYLNSTGESLPKETDWEPVLNLTASVKENKIYREKFSNVITHTVAFNLNGGNIGGKTTIDSITVEDGERITSPGSPARTHYIFNGWSPNISSFITSDTTFIAQWTAVTYTFTFQLNGGNISGSTSDRTTSGPYNTNSSTPANPVRTHFTFDGWSPTVPTRFDGNKTFIAQWAPETYTFTFKLNGGNISGSTADRTTSGIYNSNSSTPANPTRTHYTFDGWDPTVPSKFDANRTFTAQWTAVTYTFTFKLDGGSIGGSTSDRTTSGPYNSNSSTPANPTKTHYTFNAWSPAVPARFDGNKTFTATWTPVTYTFTFKMNGGNIGGSTADVTTSGAYGTASKKPANPTRTHYTFDKWNPTFPTTFTGNNTYTAQWIPVTYTFTFQLNGGSSGGSSTDKTTSGPYGSASTTPTNPTRTHYTFSGWSPAVPSTFDQNRTFTAQWTAVTYTFTFDLNGGNIGGSTTNQTRSGVYNTSSSTPANPTRTHYTFSGWSPAVPSVFDGNKTFTAGWTAVTYTFTFKMNGGNIGGSTADKTTSGLYNTNSSKPEDPVRTHYSFNDWSPTVPAKFDGNKTFTAQWAPMIYTFTFDLNGGNIDGSTSNKTYSGAYDTTSSKPEDPKRTHYTFAGWTPAVPARFDQNRTFTAGWTPVTYTFTFKLDGGSIGGSTADRTTSGAYNTNSSTPTTPTKTHYTFNGWNPAVPARFDGNKTFTALWTPVTYTFTFKLNGGNIGGSTTDKTTSGAYGSTSTTPANPTRTHYTFSAWSPAVPSTFDQDRTFTAQWTAVTYTFTFKLNGGNIGGSTTDKTTSGVYNTASSTPANPVRTHYIFAGWSPAVPSTYTGNNTYTAQWTIVTYTFTFKLDGGSIGGSTADRTTSGEYNTNSSTPTSPTKTHYTFNGWSPTVPAKFDGNKTFTAQWAPVVYTFTFNLNGGNIGGSTSNKTTSGAYNTTSSTPANPTRTHYTFSAWSPAVPATFDQDRTFTAGWTAVTYTFTFKLNGGSIGGSTADRTTSGAYGSTSSTPANPTRTHYTFAGWSPSVPSTFTGNNTYKATWTPVTYTFTFKMNGGNIGGSTSDKTTSGAYGSTSSKPANPVRTHYTFSAWSPAVPSTFTGNNTYTAQWTVVTYTFTFNLNGGNIGGSTSNKTTSGAYNTTSSKPADPVRTGYVFVNWNPTVPGTFTGNNTYTAVWTRHMEIQMRKAAVGDSILVPITLVSGQTASVSVNNAAFTNVSANYPTYTNSVAANTTFTVRIIGRIAKFSYEGRSATHAAQAYKVIYWGEVGGSTYRFSISDAAGCPNLIGPLPSPTTASFANATTFEIAFLNCAKLNGSIPTDLFSNAPNVTSYWSTFFGCKALTGSIPANMFTNSKKVISFKGTFWDCSGLTGAIPSTVFGGSGGSTTTITEISFCFTDCSGLTGAIPSGIFANKSNVIHYSSVFYGCTKLTSIPSALFTATTKMQQAQRSFYGCTGLTGSIPSDLMRNQSSLTTVKGLFTGCTKLTGISSTMFDGSNNITDFASAFQDCTALTGTAPALWNRTNVPTAGKTACFKGCTKLSNYSSVPSAWR